MRPVGSLVRALRPTIGVSHRRLVGTQTHPILPLERTVMSTELAGKPVAFLVAPEGAEQVELTEPWKAVEQAAGNPQLISTEPGRVQAFNHLDKGDTFAVDAVVDGNDTSSYEALVLPGGVANPDFLRAQAPAVAFVRGFVDASKPVVVVCHGAWTLIEADVVRAGPSLVGQA